MSGRAPTIRICAPYARYPLVRPSTASICAGTGQILTVNGGNTYQWYRNDTLITGATGSTLSATVAGVYSADIIVGSCRVKASNTSTITVNPLPSGNISPAIAAICGSNSVTLTANGGASYLWYRNNVLISGATAATYNATLAGTYSVNIISAAGCSEKASNETVVTVTPLPTGNISPTTGILCATNQVCHPYPAHLRRPGRRILHQFCSPFPAQLNSPA